MLKMMQVLRENIPHPVNMDFLLYLTARNHPRGDDFITNVLLMEMKQDLVFRNHLDMCVIERSKIVLHIKGNEKVKHGFRIRGVAERAINRVYRGLDLGESGPFGGEVVYSVDYSYTQATVTISSPSPIEYCDNELIKEKETVRREVFEDALSVTSCDFGLSETGTDLARLHRELDNTTRKIDREINELMQRKTKILAMIGDVSRHERELRAKVANEYITLTGELDERMSELNQQSYFFDMPPRG